MSVMETIFWTLAIIGATAAVFAVLSGLAKLCEVLCDRWEER